MYIPDFQTNSLAMLCLILRDASLVDSLYLPQPFGIPVALEHQSNIVPPSDPHPVLSHSGMPSPCSAEKMRDTEGREGHRETAPSACAQAVTQLLTRGRLLPAPESLLPLPLRPFIPAASASSASTASLSRPRTAHPTAQLA